MRLERIALRPFAGFGEKELAFAPGLNVVVGANDVGKSSVFRAIESALFLRAKVSRSTREGKEILPRVIPVGGDHARVSLDLVARGGRHRLEKVWGQGATATLEGEGGARLAQEERVEESLRALLPAPPATFQSVLLMGQGALEGTVAMLDRERAALHSLGDILRLSIDQTAGISVERLRALLAERIESAFAHWDRQANMPERGKGIEDPWSRNVGSVLEAYYSRERRKREWREVTELEAERDRKLAALNEKQGALDAARAFVRENEGLVAAASERQALESRITQGEREGAALEKDLHAWLRAEGDARLFRPDVDRLEARRKTLDEELRLALEQAKRRDRLQRLERARAAREGVASARAKLQALPALKPEDLKRLRTAGLEVDRLKGQLKGGKLQLQLHVKRDLEVSVRKDFEPERSGTMPAGKAMTLHAGGRIQVSNEWFELQVTGGEGGFGELEERLTRAGEAHVRLLKDLGVANLEEAEDRWSQLAAVQAELRAADGELQRALPPGESFEALERAVGSSESAGQREPDVIRAELLLVQGELEGKRHGLTGSESVLQSLRERSGLADSASASMRLVERKTSLATLAAELRALPALPERIGRLEDFLPRFHAARAGLGPLSDEIGLLRGEVAEVKTLLSDRSGQELERAYRESAEAFDRELARGRAFLRVEAAVQALEGEGGDRYGGFRADLEKLVHELSGGKYRKTVLEEALPTEFERQDGAAIPFGWLSAGTKDAFALALRLAMASHFLGEAEGFLLIDDPLVNMDPERQRTAAGFLREFAARRQVVVFTCHPSHADLLGGNRIEL